MTVRLNRIRPHQTPPGRGLVTDLVQPMKSEPIGNASFASFAHSVNFRRALGLRTTPCMHGVVSSVVSRLSVVSTLTVMLGVADALTTSKTVYFVRHGQVHPAAPFHPLAVVQLERGMRVAG